MNFWKYFVAEQNLTRPKDDFWSYLSRLCQIVVVWDNRTTVNMDPCWGEKGNFVLYPKKY